MAEFERLNIKKKKYDIKRTINSSGLCHNTPMQTSRIKTFQILIFTIFQVKKKSNLNSSSDKRSLSSSPKMSELSLSLLKGIYGIYYFIVKIIYYDVKYKIKWKYIFRVVVAWNNFGFLTREFKARTEIPICILILLFKLLTHNTNDVVK